MNNTNLNFMDDNQKEVALGIIRKKAISTIVKALLIAAFVWIFIYLVLYIDNSKASDVAANAMLATFVTAIIGVAFVERIINNILILNKVKKLEKDNLYWIIVPVKKCTCSINIFERWYRYAHYEYDGKMHRDWMLIGKMPITKVTCLVPESYTSMSYGFFYGWFKGVLY
ncbi:MAG: hypothetical protein E7258_05500 [Lachnospiraceae bacterium]|nr:hypothetical protein [Lachnospiraceae bacterium]